MSINILLSRIKEKVHQNTQDKEVLNQLFIEFNEKKEQSNENFILEYINLIKELLIKFPIPEYKPVLDNILNKDELRILLKNIICKYNFVKNNPSVFGHLRVNSSRLIIDFINKSF